MANRLEELGMKFRDRAARYDKDAAVELYQYYVKETGALKVNAQAGITAIMARLKEYSKALLKNTIDNYARHINENRLDRKYRVRCHNFFGRKAVFLDYISDEPQTCVVVPIVVAEEENSDIDICDTVGVDF